MNHQVNKDLEHLKILSILFYVLAGLTLFPVVMGLIYAVMGLFFGVAMLSSTGEPPAALFGGIFVIIGGFLVVLFATLGFLRRSRMRGIKETLGPKWLGSAIRRQKPPSPSVCRPRGAGETLDRGRSSSA